MLLYVCTVLRCIDLYECFECLSVVVCLHSASSLKDLFECFECLSVVVCVHSASLH